MRGGKKYAQFVLILYLMNFCNIQSSIRREQYFETRNVFCILALSIYCYKILIRLRGHRDLKSHFWRYTLVHNFCPPLR